MYRHLPNQLTVLRLVLAAVFFLTLNFYRYPNEGRAAIPAAIVLFILAAITDWLDGFLARRWKVESTFGRIMDPFCDKVLILGAFIYLSGPRFVDPVAVEKHLFFTMSSGVYPWMVALMLARELLVTNVRDELEGQGVKFGASMFGKVKMVMQAVGIPIILLLVWLDPHRPGREHLGVLRDVLVYTTVVATVLSGVPYVISAGAALRGGPPAGPVK